MLLHPAPAEEVVAGDARAALAEVRDHGAAGDHRSSSPARASVRTPSSRAVVVDDEQRARSPLSSRSETAFRTVVEAGTAGGGPLARRPVEVEIAEPPPREPPERPVLADELRDEVVGRVREDRVGRVVLREHAALAQDRDPVAHHDRLVDVVGDEDHRLRRPPGAARELALEPGARDRVERAERLVHQQRAAGRRRARGRGRRAAAGRPRAGSGSACRRSAPARRARAARRCAPAIRLRSQPSSFGTVAMFSAIVMCGKRPTCWIT